MFETAVPALGGLVVLALVDSTSVGTLGVPAVMLAQRRIRPGVIVFYLLALALFYWVVGLVLLQGMTWALDALGGVVEDRTVDIAQIVLGVALFALSFVVLPPGKKRQEERRRRRAESPGPVQRLLTHVLGENASVRAVVSLAFVAGVAELATMVPYLAAIGIIIGLDLSGGVEAAVLLAYVAVMIAPALVLLVVRLTGADAIEPFLDKLASWVRNAGDTTLGWVLGVVGVLLVLDGVGRLQMAGAL